jgi:Putative peptidoglycan binding domain
MIKIFSSAAMAAMILLAWNADGATAVQKNLPAKKTAAKRKVSPAKKSGAATASSRKPGTTTRTAATRGKKTPVKRGVTWRNRQMSPSPDRYREIQGALAAKGFLPPEDATGAWNQTSADALKKFQTDQNLESSGKINSLSLIALGLGPRRDSAPAAPPKSAPQAPPGQ